jgi:gamma-glutamylcyclotransferase (GGCT)/AIG2-like uncharacterized protein YtfP
MTRLRLFVYGSLKRGFSNYNRFCRGVHTMEDALIEGSLYLMPTGYPALRLSESLVLARAAASCAADIETEERFAKSLAAGMNYPARFRPGASRFHGTILTFANPLQRLRAMDVLEEFRPGHRSRYERVLIPAYSRASQSEVPVWTYIAAELSPRGRRIPSGRWLGQK